MGAADALGALGDWGRAAIPALLSRIHDEEWWVRESVYMALTAMHNEQSRKALIDVMTAERHSVIWFQAHGKILKPVQEDPELHEPLALAYAQWLQKGDVWTAPFAARGKFNAGLGGLERYVKESIPIPESVASVIKGILDGKVNDGKTIQVGVDNNIGNIPVNKYLSRGQVDDLVSRNPAI